MVTGGLALSALTIGTAADGWFAFWFVVGASASLALLRISAAALKRLARRIRAARWTELRLAVANLYRPGASTNSVVLSLGLGLAVLVAISLIESNLSRQVDERLPEMAPAFFFIDIQTHQVAAFDKILAGFDGTGAYRRVASLRGRIVKIAGQPVDQVTIASGSQWAVRGDRALTFAVAPSEGTRIVSGDWWPADYSGPPRISLDAQIARDFGVGVGDTLTLNILGREIEAEIGSLRAIDWRSIRMDFAIIFLLARSRTRHIVILPLCKRRSRWKIESKMPWLPNSITFLSFGCARPCSLHQTFLQDRCGCPGDGGGYDYRGDPRACGRRCGRSSPSCV